MSRDRFCKYGYDRVVINACSGRKTAESHASIRMHSPCFIQPPAAVRRAAALFITAAVSAAHAAADRPVIEIHPVIDCNSKPGAAPLTVDGPTVDRFGKPFSACVGRELIVGGADVTNAQHTKARVGGDALTITLSARGRQLFAKYTLGHVTDQIAIVIDGRTVSAPVIAEPILGATLQITGITAAEIDVLVARFQS